MSASSLKERPIGPDDFVDDSNKRWAWGLAPLAVAILSQIVVALLRYRPWEYEYQVEPYWYSVFYRFNLVLYLVLALLALWACRAYRGSGTAGAKSPITTVVVSLALIVTVVVISDAPDIIYLLRQGESLNWTFIGYDFGDTLARTMPQLIYVVFREASLRGVVIGSLLRNSSTPRSAILTATGFEFLAALPFIVVFLFNSLINRGYGSPVSTAIEVAVALVMPIVIGLGFGALRIASGRLWPCVLVGVLTFLASTFVYPI